MGASTTERTARATGFFPAAIKTLGHLRDGAVRTLWPRWIGGRIGARPDLIEIQRLYGLSEGIAHVGHWRLNRHDLTCRRWSEETSRIFGFEPGDKPPEFDSAVDCYAPEDRQRIVACVKHAKQTGAGFSIEAVLLRPNGERRNVIIRALDADPDDDQADLFGVIMDITDLKRAEAKALESTCSFRMLVEAVSEYAIYMLDTEGRITNWNVGAERIKGYAASEIIGQDFSCFFPTPDIAAGLPAMILAATEREGRWKGEGQRVRKDGSIFWASILVQALRDEAGTLIGFAKITRDITERRQAELDLRASEARYRILADNASDMIVHLELDGTQRFVSPASCHLFGYASDDLSGTKMFDILHPEDADAYRATLDGLAAGRTDHAVCQQRYRCKDGHYVWGETTLATLRDDDQSAIGFVGAVRDITERKASEDRAIYLAHHDPLTELPNRTFFRERLEKAAERVRNSSAAFAVLLIDLDRFKSFNDSFGHSAGDRLLCQVAARIRCAVHAKDLVVRLAGDEFAVLVEDIEDVDAVRSLARTVIDRVAEPMEVEGHIIAVGLSIGISIGEDAKCDGDLLLKNADLAMYRAKASGRRNYRVYEPAMDAATQARLVLEIEMREAIALGDFDLYYQPVMNMTTGATSGYEALLRWDHQTRGLMAPFEFIPLAEDSGLIVPLGHWTLRKACLQAATWSGGRFVSVNVSALQFREGGLEASVAAALDASGLAPHRLELEITESVLIEDVEGVTACLHRLKKAGLRIVLDDFGTGFSSLSYLRRFPFDKIKIDRSFIAEMDHPGTAAIIRSIISLAAVLSAEVVAEGIETREQQQFLNAAGCSFGQGYMFGRPVPMTRIERGEHAPVAQHTRLPRDMRRKSGG